MDKHRTIFHELLALDSIYHVLLYSDRLFLHRCISGSVEDHEEGSEKLYQLQEAKKKHRWHPPFMKYPEFDKDQLYYENGNADLRPITEYAALNKELTETILKIQ